MLWKIVLVLGVLGILLGFIVTGGFIAAPELTSGRIAWDEAIWGIIAGGLVLVVSFLMFLVGLIFVIMNRKKNKAAVNTV